MRAKTYRNIACLLALSIGLALGGAEIGTASASTPAGSDPAAVAVLRQAQAIATPPHAGARMLLTAPSATGPSTNRSDATPIMIALARALPRLSAADQAQARQVLDPTATGRGCGDTDSNHVYYTRYTAHFAITYSVDAPNTLDPNTNAVSSDTDSNGNNLYVNKVADVLENHVYAHEITSMGFKAPQAPNGGVQIPIQLCNIGQGYYGYCAPASLIGNGPAATAACTLRNSYDPPTCPSNPSTCIYYQPGLDGSDLDAPLKVTAAHEFFHAVQFRQNSFSTTDTPPLWLMEGTAVWMENEVYPAIHDYFQYLPATGIRNPSVPFNITVTSDDFAENPSALWPFAVYADFAFFKFLSGWLHDPGAVRQMWNYLGMHPNAAPMTALNAVLATHYRTRLRMLLNWGIWNTLPPGSYPARAAYAPVGWWQARKLDRSRRTFKSPVANIRPFADAPIRINRGAQVRPGTKLRVVVNGPSYVAGGYYTYRIVKTNGVNLTVTRQIGPRGSAFVIPFNRSVSYVVFTLNNTNASRTKRFQISTTVL